MNIQSVRYTQPDENWVEITFDDDSKGTTSTTDGIRRQYTDQLDEWLGEGNTIDQYDHLHGQDILDVKNNKYAEIWAYGNSLIGYETEHSDTTSNTVTGKSKKISDKSQKRLTKKSKGQSLTPDEEADEDWFDSFLDWEDSINDTSDSGCDTVESMSDKYLVDDFDPATDIIWPAFTP